MRNISYERELFKRILKNPSFKKIRDIFKSFSKTAIFFLTDERGVSSPYFKLSKIAKKCKFYGLLSEKEKNVCHRNFVSILKKSEKSRRGEPFSCKNRTYGFCVPIVQGDRIYGYIGFCQLDKEPPKDLILMLEIVIETILKESQKEFELSKLYETIRPRAIALSTVHTIYRLISSTLNLEELLPRIARLFSQVLRSDECFITLLDEEPEVLPVRVAIDNKKKRPSRKEIIKARLLERRVIKYGKSIIKRNSLSIPLIDEDTVGVISVLGRSGKGFNLFDQEIMSRLTEQAVIAIKNAKLYKEQENITLASIKSLASVLEARAPKTYRNTAFFVKLVLAIGGEMHLGEDELKALQYAALLHDASQAALPDDILTKHAKLTDKEYKIVKFLPFKSAKILEPLKLLKPAMPIILFHHENFDGSGYPKGLKGSEIPLGARIMAVVGAFLAMTARRPYREKLNVNRAIDEIKRGSSKQFDPDIVNIFLKIMERDDIKLILKKKHYEIR